MITTKSENGVDVHSEVFFSRGEIVFEKSEKKNATFISHVNEITCLIEIEIECLGIRPKNTFKNKFLKFIGWPQINELYCFQKKIERCVSVWALEKLPV